MRGVLLGISNTHTNGSLGPAAPVALKSWLLPASQMRDLRPDIQVGIFEGWWQPVGRCRLPVAACKTPLLQAPGWQQQGLVESPSPATQAHSSQTASSSLGKGKAHPLGSGVSSLKLIFSSSRSNKAGSNWNSPAPGGCRECCCLEAPPPSVKARTLFPRIPSP